MWRGREGLFLGLASLSLSLFSLASEPNKLGGGGKTDMSDIHPSVLADPALLVGPLQPETQLPSNFSPH